MADENDPEVTEIENVIADNSDDEKDEYEEDDEDYPIPKNLRCVAHILQLCLKDVFENNSAMKEMKK